MPTRLPVSMPMLPGGPLNPVDWLALGGEAGGIAQEGLMRGTPGMAYWQRRQIPTQELTPFGGPFYIQSRPYDRGAQAFSPKFGSIVANVIGAGVYSPYKLPVSGGPAARYQFGAIWFDVQTVPTSLQLSPTMPIASANALISQSYVAAMYATTG